MSTRQRFAFLAAGSAAQLGLWLTLRPDTSGATWTIGNSYETWIGLEALTAIVIGALAVDRKLASQTVALGWVLQGLHFALFGEHYNEPLWPIGLFVQALLAGAALVLAFVSQRLTRTRSDARPLG